MLICLSEMKKSSHIHRWTRNGFEFGKSWLIEKSSLKEWKWRLPHIKRLFPPWWVCAEALWWVINNNADLFQSIHLQTAWDGKNLLHMAEIIYCACWSSKNCWTRLDLLSHCESSMATVSLASIEHWLWESQTIWSNYPPSLQLLLNKVKLHLEKSV